MIAFCFIAVAFGCLIATAVAIPLTGPSSIQVRLFQYLSNVLALRMRKHAPQSTVNTIRRFVSRLREGGRWQRRRDER
jgi:acyl-CoA synthetase (AMP-forming)/AMP-acid ligase II